MLGVGCVCTRYGFVIRFRARDCTYICADGAPPPPPPQAVDLLEPEPQPDQKDKQARAADMPVGQVRLASVWVVLSVQRARLAPVAQVRWLRAAYVKHKTSHRVVLHSLCCLLCLCVTVCTHTFGRLEAEPDIGFIRAGAGPTGEQGRGRDGC